MSEEVKATLTIECLYVPGDYVRFEISGLQGFGVIDYVHGFRVTKDHRIWPIYYIEALSGGRHLVDEEDMQSFEAYVNQVKTKLSIKAANMITDRPIIEGFKEVDE